MPNQPATPTITFRCPPDLRAGLERIAEERGVSLTEVILGACWREVRSWPGLET